MATTRDEALAVATQALVGHEVLWVISDASSGSLINFDPRRRRDRTIPNSALTPEQQNFEGDQAVFVRCAWQLRDGEGRITVEYGSGSPPAALNALDSLAGHRVTAAETRESVGLQLVFEDRVTLQVDPRTKAAEFAAYTIYRQREWCSVFSDGRVETGP